MIKVKRTGLNDQLAAAVAGRVQALRDHLEAGTEIPEALLRAYRNPAVKAHLVAEAHGKCVYCESKITHVYFGDVEHIKPKDRFPAERLSMENLALACAQCNNAKGNYWSDDLFLLNPYEDEPEEELLAFGFYVVRKPANDRARVTLSQLDLNRQSLLERRRERVDLLQPLVDQYVAAPPGPIKEVLLSELQMQIKDHAEYAMVVRSYLKATCGIEAKVAAEHPPD